MSRPKAGSLAPLRQADEGPLFDAPWQAGALALADALVAKGLFSATTWSQALGAALRRAEAEGAPDGKETYYAAVLAALERLLGEAGAVSAASLTRRRDAWEAAYRATPHGQPVELPPAARES